LQNYYAARRYSLEWWWAVINIVIMLIGCSFIFVKIFGYQYIPTKEWMALSSGAATAVGIETAVFGVWATKKNVKDPPRFAQAVKVVFVFAFVILSCLFLGRAFVFSGAPLIVAAIAGGDVEAQYVVKDASSWGDGKCRNPVYLEDMKGIFWDRLCFFPQDLRVELDPGSKIAVTGKGTFAGLFVERAGRMQ